MSDGIDDIDCSQYDTPEHELSGHNFAVVKESNLVQQLADAKAEIVELAEIIEGRWENDSGILESQYQRALALKRKATE